MEKRRRTPSLGTPGAGSLMIIFCVLCLAVFAVLAASEVTADGRLSEASMESVEEYYEADCLCEEILARLRGGELPEGVEREGNIYSWSCPMGENRALAARVEISGSEYEILQWQAVYTADWSPEEGLQLLGGA